MGSLKDDIVDIFISSAELPKQFTGLDDLRAALRALRERYSCAVMGATLGIAGSLIYANAGFVETASCPVPGGCIDTTGAGDAFRAGFLYGV